MLLTWLYEAGYFISQMRRLRDRTFKAFAEAHMAHKELMISRGDAKPMEE